MTRAAVTAAGHPCVASAGDRCAGDDRLLAAAICGKARASSTLFFGTQEVGSWELLGGESKIKVQKNCQYQYLYI